MKPSIHVVLPIVTASLLAAAGCARTPPEVSYEADVVPILEKHCRSCHTPGQSGYVVSGFDLENYDSLMKGTTYGPVVLPGDPLTSALVMLIEGRVDPSIKMPHGGMNPMTEEEILTVRRWVEQGAQNN